MTSEYEEEYEEIDPQDDLMGSAVIGIRVFVTRDIARTVVLGIVLGEGDDSFLVGLPTTTGEHGITPYFKAPYIRLMKSEVSIVAMAEEELESAFLAYVQDKGYQLYPDLVSQLGELLGVEITVKRATTEMTQEQLEQHVEDVESQGMLVTDNETVH